MGEEARMGANARRARKVRRKYDRFLKDASRAHLLRCEVEGVQKVDSTRVGEKRPPETRGNGGDAKREKDTGMM